MQSNIKEFAIFPDLPRQTPVTAEDGTMHSLWVLYFDQLTNALQTNFKPEGIAVPQQTAANISNLTSSGGDANIKTGSDANIIYDSTNNAINARIKNTTTSAWSWVQLVTIIDNAGNPNGVVAGNLNQLCLDTTNKILYVCTTAGDATSTVWTST